MIVTRMLQIEIAGIDASFLDYCITDKAAKTDAMILMANQHLQTATELICYLCT